MHRSLPIAVLLLAAATATTAACGRRAASADPAPAQGTTQGSAVAAGTLRRAGLTLRVDPDSVAINGETLPLVLRVTNPERRAMRVDFTGDPLFPRGPRDRVMTPAIWYQMERVAPTQYYVGHVQRRFRMRDTVLGPGESFEVPLEHALREVGFAEAGLHRIRVGIGAHVSDWARFRVTGR
jgi:hypothetical protein